MTMVITPEIPRAKDAQDVGFRWVSFTRASPPKVGQFWMRANISLGTGQWWTVPSAVLVGIPLYSNVTGIIPIMESLLLKGLPIGTTLAFCMSSVAASIPEFMMLRQIMTIKLQATFILYLWVVFTLVGWLLNAM
ncbi:permease [Pseudomonas aeruginosa]